MHDYARVEAIIRYLDEHHTGQPGLEELALAAGVSSFHLHRLFHRWAGITPKDFLQCLTAEHAKQRLRDSCSVLEAALDAGLSGPGRLHDLLVNLEAASPGEIKSGGAGLRIDWGWARSPFGRCSLAWNERGICHLAFQKSAKANAKDTQNDTERENDSPPADLLGAWPKAQFRRAAANDVGGRAAAIFGNGGGAAATNRPGLKAFVGGTEFQVKVWRALLRIPEGQVSSYAALARAIGVPEASRAVGAACGANPIAYLIPCHRVIRQTGIVEGYRWGSERKRAMLAWEASRQR